MTITSGIPPWRPFTVDDLEAMPDDGRRHELIDGMLIMSPTPGRRHQRALLKLVVALDSACPDSMHVLLGPLAVRPSDDTELRPDALVARADDLGETHLAAAPVLTIEVLEPSTEINDLNNKKAAYERMGVPCYWVVDPRQPSLIVFELDDGRYRQVAEVNGDEVFVAERPFAVRIVPAELLDTDG